MKKVLFSILAASILFACAEPKKEEAATTPMEHIYKPTYTDNFKIGDQKNAYLAEKFHQDLFAKDYKKAGEIIADTAEFHNEDGSTLKGKAAILDFMEKAFSQVKFKNYEIVAIIPTVGENGHQWVNIWDKADVETPDGKTQKLVWVDSFRFENGKVVMFEGFVKALKE
mgnify:CR=1 FL=1